MSLRRVLALVREFRRRTQTTPVVLMGYANPIEAMGVEAFARAARGRRRWRAGGRLSARGVRGFAATLMKQAASIRSSCWRRRRPSSASRRSRDRPAATSTTCR
jgi:hypothetical protein